MRALMGGYCMRGYVVLVEVLVEIRMIASEGRASRELLSDRRRAWVCVGALE